MSKREIISKLSRDFNISKYSAESDNGFISRISYSALGVWARFLASYNDDSSKEIGNIFKSTHHRKLVGVLRNYEDLFEEISEFYNTEDPIALLRSSLLASGDLIEIGFDSRISIALQTALYIDEGIIAETSFQQFPEKAVASGLAALKLTPQSTDTVRTLLAGFGVPEISAKSALVARIKDASWEQIVSLEDYEYFDSNRKGVLSSCWIQFYALTDVPCLVRRKTSFGPYEYSMAKREPTGIYLSRFTEFEQSDLVRVPQRMMYGFKSSSRNRCTANVDVYKNYSVWHFWSKLPPQEEHLLRYIGWPVGNIENRANEYVVRNELNELLRQVADNLGLIREEIRHE